jgi:hypothetical protein
LVRPDAPRRPDTPDIPRVRHQTDHDVHDQRHIQLSWTAQASAGCGNLIVTASVYAKGKNPNSDIPDGGPFDQTGCSPYTTEVNVSSGQYFLDLSVGNGTAVLR